MFTMNELISDKKVKSGTNSTHMKCKNLRLHVNGCSWSEIKIYLFICPEQQIRPSLKQIYHVGTRLIHKIYLKNIIGNLFLNIISQKKI